MADAGVCVEMSCLPVQSSPPTEALPFKVSAQISPHNPADLDLGVYVCVCVCVHNIYFPKGQSAGLHGSPSGP